MGTGNTFARVGLAWLAALALAAPAFAECREEQAQFRWQGGQAQFNIEIADDAGERAIGLMRRESLATSAGMLFIYERTQPVAFWMRNTLIPLDMIFIDPAGAVVKVHENAKPLDETPIPSEAPVRFVLEINGGLAKRMGIQPGAELRHPAIQQDIAIWPCE